MAESMSWKGCLADIVARLRHSSVAYDVEPRNLLLGHAHIVRLIDKFESLYDPPDGETPMYPTGLADYVDANIRWHTPDASDDWKPVYAIPSSQFTRLCAAADQAINAMIAAGLALPLASGGSGNPVHNAYCSLAEVRDGLEDAQQRGGPWLLLERPPDDFAASLQAAIEACPKPVGALTGEAAPSAEVPADATPSKPSIPPRAQKAGDQYRLAAEALGATDPTDRQAYDQLHAAMETSGEKADLPAFDTWQRNLREYRRRTGQQKNKPRAGRKQSVVSCARPDQLDVKELPTSIRPPSADK